MDTYEKKYNEALERARNLMAMYPQDAPGYKEVFPELRESEDERIRVRNFMMKQFFKPISPDLADDLADAILKVSRIALNEKQKTYNPTDEDERIRKEIIEFIQWSEDRGMTRHDFHQAKRPSEWLTWLEKQKAKEKYDRMAPIYNDQQSFEDALDKAWKFYNDSGSSTVDRCEDNPIKLAFAKGFREGFLYRGKQKEQKPAEYIPDSVKFSEGYKTGREVGFREGVESVKSAEWSDYKDKVNVPYCSSEPEWSEEDERILTGIIERGSVQVPPYTTALREEQIEWLENRFKSLRPDSYKKCNSRWKPSKEQMAGLLVAIGDEKERGSDVAKTLRSLYEHLKKL